MSTAARTGWRVLPAEEDEPERLLDRSLALLDGLAEDPVPTLRWYRSSSPAIVLGRGQGRVDVAARDGLRVIMRASGGGAVLLDEGLLSLDVLLPPDDPWLSDDLGGVFLRVGEAWARALRRLDVDDVTVHDGPSTTPRRQDPTQRIVAAVCYASLGRGEVLAAGRKVVGLAQRRRRHGTLVQCGLLRAWDPRGLVAALGGDPADERVAGAAVGIDDLVSPVPTDADVMAAVEAALCEARADDDTDPAPHGTEASMRSTP